MLKGANRAEVVQSIRMRVEPRSRPFSPAAECGREVGTQLNKEKTKKTEPGRLKQRRTFVNVDVNFRENVLQR